MCVPLQLPLTQMQLIELQHHLSQPHGGATPLQALLQAYQQQLLLSAALQQQQQQRQQAPAKPANALFAGPQCSAATSVASTLAPTSAGL